MRATTKFLSGMYAVTGVLHFAVPRVYDDIIPVPLGRWDRELTYLSGVAELACAAGLAHPRTRRGAAWASAALLVAVFPANVQMSLDHGRRARRKNTGRAWGVFAGTVARLPLQWPLVRVALRAAGRG